MKTLPTLLILLLITTQQVFSELPRRGALGAQLLGVNDSVAKANDLSEGSGGALINFIVDNSAAQQMGLMKGDVITSLNGAGVDDAGFVVRSIGSMQQGDEVSFDVVRDGERIKISGPLKGFPAETSPFADVIYDAVPFAGGHLRTIIHKPHKEGKMPAVFFIQGFDCQSVDNMHRLNAFNRYLQGLSESGYVVVKTEKPGVGDSRNDCDCQDTDFLTEVDAFSASFNSLSKFDFIDTSNVFIFGFSMGGVQAPLLNTDFDPKGIMVFGTIARPWFEYFIGIIRWQRLITGQDYVLNEENYNSGLRFFYHFMIEKQTPRELAQDEEMREFLESFFSWDQEGLLNGRNYRFWQQLQDVKTFKAWSNTPAYVLSLWGEGDFVAFDSREHKLIADIVNHYNPGKAEFVVVPDTDHALNFVEDQEHSVKIWGDWQYSADNFNPAIIEISDNWMKQVINPE